MNVTWWALFLAAVAGIVLTAGSLSGRYARGTVVAALVLFTVAAALALVTVVD